MPKGLQNLVFKITRLKQLDYNALNQLKTVIFPYFDLGKRYDGQKNFSWMASHKSVPGFR